MTSTALLPHDAMIARHVSVHLSYVSIAPKQLNVRSQKRCRTIAQDSYCDAKDLSEIPTGSPPNRSANQRWGRHPRFPTNLTISQKQYKIET